ncbi:toll/interleukin-1 receptor domain-containing protein, partial [Candidatus Pacearchaeota archaeon]|nr:toll/interleukin-1 receptor domain-containing protein [Candidatus Pacearchaeota archaeon]
MSTDDTEKSQSHQPCIFLSYASEDHEFAERLGADLERANIVVMMSNYFMAGSEHFDSFIANPLESADYVGVILTPNAVASKWVELEWHAAVS